MDALLFYNETGYLQAEEKFISIGEDYIQVVVDKYVNLNIGDLQADELSKLFNKPDDLLFDKATGGALIVNGVTLDRSKAIELTQKPAGYADLISSIKATNEYLKNERISGFGNLNLAFIDRYFELLDGNIVLVKEDFKHQVRESFKVFAKSDKAKTMKDFAQSIIDKVEELGIRDINYGVGASLGHIVNSVVNYQFDKVPSLKIEGILEYN